MVLLVNCVFRFMNSFLYTSTLPGIELVRYLVGKHKQCHELIAIKKIPKLVCKPYVVNFIKITLPSLNFFGKLCLLRVHSGLIRGYSSVCCKNIRKTGIGVRDPCFHQGPKVEKLLFNTVL